MLLLCRLINLVSLRVNFARLAAPTSSKTWLISAREPSQAKSLRARAGSRVLNFFLSPTRDEFKHVLKKFD
jgi:hypothetical protein